MVNSNPNNGSLSKHLLVFIDLSVELDEDAKGIVSEASRLAGILGCEWSGIAFAGPGDETLKELAPYGVDEIYLLDVPEAVLDSKELQAKLLASMADKIEHSVLLLAHNDLGETLAPLLAAELEAALFTEAIAFVHTGEQLQLTRHHLGAQLAESKLYDGKYRLVLTVASQLLSSVVLPSMREGNCRVTRFTPHIPEIELTTRIIERIPADPLTVDVSEAEVMVSAGLGCDKNGFERVEELSRQLGASLGVTRPVFDLGFTGFERMVGQTGKTVAPKFYLALGISGSMHHVGGIKDSKRIVSVNIDPKAPIFTNSDEGFVADLREVLPLLIERLESTAGGTR